MTFHKSTNNRQESILINGYCLCENIHIHTYNIKYTGIFFCVCALLSKFSVHSRTEERVKEKLYPLVSSNSDDSSQPINVLQ